MTKIRCWWKFSENKNQLVIEQLSENGSTWNFEFNPENNDWILVNVANTPAFVKTYNSPVLAVDYISVIDIIKDVWSFGITAMKISTESGFHESGHATIKDNELILQGNESGMGMSWKIIYNLENNVWEVYEVSDHGSEFFKKFNDPISAMAAAKHELT